MRRGQKRSGRSGSDAHAKRFQKNLVVTKMLGFLEGGDDKHLRGILSTGFGARTLSLFQPDRRLAVCRGCLLVCLALLVRSIASRCFSLLALWVCWQFLFQMARRRLLPNFLATKIEVCLPVQFSASMSAIDGSLVPYDRYIPSS